MAVTWQQIMSAAFVAMVAYVIYLYIQGRITLGPDIIERTLVRDGAAGCPPPDCDCALLRGRIQYLDRKLHDTENALLKAEGIYDGLYKKYSIMSEQLDSVTKAKDTADATVVALQARLANALNELGISRAAHDQLASQCIERDLQINACAPNLDHGLLR